MNFEFAWPLCFLLFIPFAAAAWRMLRRGRRAGVKFAPVRRLPAKTAGWRACVAAVAPWLFLAGAALLVVAAARPRTPLQREPENPRDSETPDEVRDLRRTDGIAIAMAVDVSGSMEALDFSMEALKSPSVRSRALKTRLDVVKETFRKFVDVRTNDLVSLVTFGGFAATRVPLTADHKMVKTVLAGVEVPKEAYDESGRSVNGEELLTAIGDGLATAIERVKDSEAKSRIVILLSDGVSNAGAVSPDVAAGAAAKLGIRVYTIGVGTRSRQTPFIGRDMFGNKVIQMADTSFDEAQLRSIAAKTGARYFRVGDTAGLRSALAEIDALEKTTLESEEYRYRRQDDDRDEKRWNELFPWFLTPGAFLVLAAVSLQIFASRRLV